MLERLNAFGLISEGQRLDALDRVSELAVEIPDADWLDIPELNDLFNDSERSSILERVRRDLVPNLDTTIGDWESNEQGESAEEYYGPLRDALQRYIKAFGSDSISVSAIEDAIEQVDQLVTEGHYWQSDENRDALPSPPTSERLRDGIDVGSNAVTVDERNIFDDVDVDIA